MSLKNGDYALLGKCISLALVYGGSGPHFFSKSLTASVFQEPIDQTDIADMADFEIKAGIQKVSAWSRSRTILYRGRHVLYCASSLPGWLYTYM